MSRDIAVPNFVDAAPLSRFHVLLVGLCALTVMMDGVDAQVMAYAAPTLRKAWSLESDALGVVFSSGLLGMMCGSMIFGIVGDRLGRKWTILLCVAGLGGFTLITATASSTIALLIWRFLAGVALGGVGPNAYALTAEYTPPRRRAFMIMLVATSFPLGGGLGALVAAPITEALGWQGVFVVSGGLTLALVPLLLWLLPDSIAQRALRGASAQEINRLADRVDPDRDRSVRLVPGEAAVKPRFPLSLLFVEGRAKVTASIWTLYFTTMLGLYFLSNWLPTLAHDAGMSLRQSVSMMSMLQFGGVAGSFVTALLISRLSASMVLTVIYLVAAAMIVTIGYGGSSPTIVAIGAVGAGLCLNGALIAIISIEANYYSTAMRSTGIGWASACGRIGAATGPFLGGLLLAAGWLRQEVFVAVSGPIVVAAIAAFFLGIMTRDGAHMGKTWSTTEAAEA